MPSIVSDEELEQINEQDIIIIDFELDEVSNNKYMLTYNGEVRYIYAPNYETAYERALDLL